MAKQELMVLMEVEPISYWMSPGQRLIPMEEDLTSILRQGFIPPGERFIVYWCLLVLSAQLHAIFVLVHNLALPGNM